MKFERRDWMLAAGTGLLAVGLIPFIAPVYAIVVAAAAFFGIKAYSIKRQRDVFKEVGIGICAECGYPLTKDGCPRCG